MKMRVPVRFVVHLKVGRYTEEINTVKVKSMLKFL